MPLLPKIRKPRTAPVTRTWAIARLQGNSDVLDDVWVEAVPEVATSLHWRAFVETGDRMWDAHSSEGWLLPAFPPRYPQPASAHGSREETALAG